MSEYRLIDYMTEGKNLLQCSCGTYIYPDCDMSSVSIAAEFNHHLRTTHNLGESDA